VVVMKISFTAIHNRGIARDKLHVRLRRSGTHRLDDAAQIVDGQALFEDERRRKIQRTSPAHGKVVDSPVDRDAANIAARKKDRRNNKRVGCKRDSSAVDGKHSLVVELVQRRIGERRQKNFIDQFRRKLAAAPMSKDDLLVLKNRDGARAGQDRRPNPRVVLSFGLLVDRQNVTHALPRCAPDFMRPM
jgi:hypothetical protein